MLSLSSKIHDSLNMNTCYGIPGPAYAHIRVVGKEELENRTTSAPNRYTQKAILRFLELKYHVANSPVRKIFLGIAALAALGCLMSKVPSGFWMQNILLNGM